VLLGLCGPAKAYCFPRMIRGHHFLCTVRIPGTTRRSSFLVSQRVTWVGLGGGSLECP
jgi:hypothetical protein